MAPQEMAGPEDRNFVWQTFQLQSGELTHRVDVVHGIFHSLVDEDIKQTHAMNSHHGRQLIERPATSVPLVITGYCPLPWHPRA